MRARTRWLTAVTLAALSSAAVARRAARRRHPTPAPRSVASPAPIAITVADSQSADKPSNLPLAEFKRQVEQLSGGSMTVTILTEAVDDVTPFSDAAVIDKVKTGAFQMAVVPARAWSDAGVTSLKALQAPFLFESDEHVAAVVDDAAITKELFSGLDGSGVTGLTLFPESLRHLFSFGEPMLTPADVKGKTIRAISSLETSAIIEALGGTAVDPAGDAYPQGIDDGTIHGTDSGFTLAIGGDPNRHSTATGNVALYAKVMTLVDQQRLVDQPRRRPARRSSRPQSDATREWAIANQMKDAAAAARFCEGGGTVVLTDAAGIAAFRAAEAPVYAALEADPATKRAIAAIRALAPAGSSAAAVEACEPVIDATTLVPDGGDLPNGIYRIEYTDAYLAANGVTDLNEEHGIWTFRLEDGHWTIDQVADNPLRNPHLAGQYQVKDRRALLDDRRTTPADTWMHLFWSVDARGDLSFSDCARSCAELVVRAPVGPGRRPGPGGPGDDQAVLDGVYRYELTEQYLLDHGVDADTPVTSQACTR